MKSDKLIGNTKEVNSVEASVASSSKASEPTHHYFDHQSQIYYPPTITTVDNSEEILTKLSNIEKRLNEVNKPSVHQQCGPELDTYASMIKAHRQSKNENESSTFEIFDD